MLSCALITNAALQKSDSNTQEKPRFSILTICLATVHSLALFLMLGSSFVRLDPHSKLLGAMYRFYLSPLVALQPSSQPMHACVFVLQDEAARQR